MKNVVGIIGGTGFAFDGGELKGEFRPALAPFSCPSGPLWANSISGVDVLYLERHGPNHRLLPGEVPYEANIVAMKEAGVTHLILITACGALDARLRPGDIVIPAQVVDATMSPPRTLFGNGVVGHINVANPFCERLRCLAIEATSSARRVPDMCLVTIPGPRFSTRAESRLWRKAGMHIIGMTTAREVGLAREAEMCCVAVAHVTDMDNPEDGEVGVTQEDVGKHLSENKKRLGEVIFKLVTAIGATSDSLCQCQTALDTALITNPYGGVPEGHWATTHPWLNRRREAYRDTR